MKKALLRVSTIALVALFIATQFIVGVSAAEYQPFDLAVLTEGIKALSNDYSQGRVYDSRIITVSNQLVYLINEVEGGTRAATEETVKTALTNADAIISKIDLSKLSVYAKIGDTTKKASLTDSQGYLNAAHTYLERIMKPYGLTKIPVVIVRRPLFNEQGNGYATIADAARAWPGCFYYNTYFTIDSQTRNRIYIGRWYAVSKVDAEKADRFLFDTKEECHAVFGEKASVIFGDFIVDWEGKWGLNGSPQFFPFYPTIEDIMREEPDAIGYNYETSIAIWYPGKMPNSYGPFGSKDEALKAAGSGSSGSAFRLVQNEYTGKWFYHFNGGSGGYH